MAVKWRCCGLLELSLLLLIEVKGSLNVYIIIFSFDLDRLLLFFWDFSLECEVTGRVEAVKANKSKQWGEGVLSIFWVRENQFCFLHELDINKRKK